MKSPVNVLYILSSDHGGSTITDMILGTHSDILSGGEIYRYEKKSINPYTDPKDQDKTVDCSCGAPTISHCPFWQKVMQDIKTTTNSHFLPIDTYQSDKCAPANHLLLSLMLQHSNKTVFCDSSKKPDRALLLLSSKQFHTYIIHLIRDPRAVAYSQEKKGRSYYAFLLYWVKKNYKYLRFQYTQSCPYTRIKYESIIANPNSYRDMINTYFKLESSHAFNLTLLNNNHLIAGNRTRSKKNQAIRHDIEYSQKISTTKWILSNILLLPLLLYFKYPLRRKSIQSTTTS